MILPNQFFFSLKRGEAQEELKIESALDAQGEGKKYYHLV